MVKFPRMPKSLLKPPPGFKKPRVQDFRDDMKQLGERIAEEFKETIEDNIRENHYGFSLADSTIQKKGHDVPLIDSEELVEAIFVDGTTVSVEDTPREDSSLTNLELAMVHEYGTKDRHIPARPVWRNTFRDFKPEARKQIETLFRTGDFKK